MSIKLASVCPVCGRPKGAVSLSEYDCAHCGFQNAYLQSFAGEESRAQWQRTVQDAQAAWRGKQRAELARAHRLTVGSHGVALWVPQENALYLALANGQLQVEQAFPLTPPVLSLRDFPSDRELLPDLHILPH